MKWPKRFACTVLALLLCVGLLPAEVFASTPAEHPTATAGSTTSPTSPLYMPPGQSASGWYVGVESTGITVSNSQLSAAQLSSLAQKLTTKPAAYGAATTGKPDVGYFILPSRMMSDVWLMVDGKTTMNISDAKKVQGHVSGGNIGSYVEPVAVGLYKSLMDQVKGSVIPATDDVIAKVQAYGLSVGRDTAFMQETWSMDQTAGIGGRQDEVSKDAHMSYIAAPRIALSNYWNYNGALNALTTDSDMLNITRYTAVMIKVLAANGTSDSEELIRQVCTSYVNCMAGKPWTIYTIWEQVAGRVHFADSGYRVMLATDYLHMKGLPLQPSASWAEASSYTSLAAATYNGTVNSIWGVTGLQGTGNVYDSTKIGGAGAVANNPAAHVVATDSSSFVASYGGFAPKTVTLGEGETAKGHPTITILGDGVNDSFAASYGFGYFTLPAAIAIHPYKNDSGKGGEFPTTQQVTLRMGTRFQTPKAEVATSSSYSVKPTLYFDFDLGTAARIDKNGHPVDDSQALNIGQLLWEMEQAAKWGPSGAGMTQYEATYNSIKNDPDTKNTGSIVDPSVIKSNGTYTYHAGDLKWTGYFKVFYDTKVGVDEGQVAQENNRGYWGDGNTPTYTYKFTSSKYSPTSGAEGKIRSAENSQMDVGAQVASAFNSKYSAETGVVATYMGSCRVDFSVDGINSETKMPKLLDYVRKNGFVLSVDISVEMHGDIDLEKEEVKTAWSFIGGGVSVKSYPQYTSVKGTYTREEKVSVNGVETPTGTVTKELSGFYYKNGPALEAVIPFDLKMDYYSVQANNPEHPTYHSEVDPNPHTEINQGTVVGTGQSGTFNSTTGTPTFTETQRSELIDNVDNTSYYNSDGHYYQYYAAGGSEFVIEFDGKYHHNETATRTFNFNWTSTTCDKDKTGNAHTHSTHQIGTTEDGAPIMCGDCHNNGDVASLHHQCGTSTIAGTSVSFSYTYTGLDYVEIRNLKVWQLVEAQAEGLYELIDTDKVTAKIVSNAPGISYNVAAGTTPESNSTNTAEYGRMVYEFCPTGAKEKSGAFSPSGDRDHLVWTKTTNNAHDAYAEKNLPEIQAVLNGAMDGAWMVSDFILLHTTKGTESIMYYEKQTKDSKPIVKKYGQWKSGKCTPYITGGCTSSPSDCTVELTRNTVEFKETTDDQLWKANSFTAKSAGYKPEGVTYGGYNGKYNSPSTKYASSTGNNENMSWSAWSQTQAYKNKSQVFSNCLRTKPSTTLTLMNDKIVIPDYKYNGVYPNSDEGFPSFVFYKNLVYLEKRAGEFPTGYANVAVSRFNNQKGFELAAGYGSSYYDKVANSVVVYNPLAINAIIQSLPQERDQRTENHLPSTTDTSYACPGDESCEFQQLNCSRSDHLHTEACYSIVNYTSHEGNNAHEHHETAGSNPDGSTYTACPYRDHAAVAGDGRWIHDSGGCSYEGQTHTTASSSYCTQCGHSCGHFLGFTNSRPAYREWLCGDKPLNKHVCKAAGTKIYDGPPDIHVHTSACGTGGAKNGTYSYAAGGTTIFSFVPTQSGTVGFYSTSYTADPRGTIAINGTWVTDDDDSGKGLNFSTSYSVSAGQRVDFIIHQYGSAGGGTCDVVFTGLAANSYTCNNLPLNSYSSAVPFHYAAGCYETTSVNFTCTDPHHTWDSCWKVYTYGLLHKDGQRCTGYNCSNTTDLQFYGKQYKSVSACAGGIIVLHSNGQAHLSTRKDGVCDYCGNQYVDVLFNATSTHRTNIPASEWTHYPSGDQRCWKACNDPTKHNTYSDSVTLPGGTVVQNGKFINLDYQYTVYYPNTGNVGGTGAAWSHKASAERGKGYQSPMDTTIWMKYKWVEFPWDCVFKGQTFLAGERIYLPVPDTVFEFYCCLENSEVYNGEVVFGATAINDSSPTVVNDARTNELQNTRQITAYRPMGHPHDVDKRFFIDVVGRIGALTIEDTGDFRYSNFFKHTLEGWLVPNVIRQVNNRDQNNLVIDPIDIRGIPINDTRIADGGALVNGSPGTAYQNTYGFRAEREKNLWGFPLTPYMLYLAENGPRKEATKAQPYPSEQDAAATQPMRIGYNAYMDFTTIGNYYGKPDSSGALINKCTVIPHYFRLDLDTGKIKPVDAYMSRNGTWVLVNDADTSIVKNASTPTDMIVSLNWVESAGRRNYAGAEIQATELVYNNMGIGMPYGSQWDYGTYDWLTLSGRNRTCIGNERTYGVNTDPSAKLDMIRSNLQGARWHFSIGLPSSSVFVYSGEACTDTNIAKCAEGNCIIAVGLEIYSDGDVWSLIYDGKNINSPFQVVQSGKTYSPTSWGTDFHYPTTPGNDPTKTPTRSEELIFIGMVSINHSSQEDVNQTGTH